MNLENIHFFNSNIEFSAKALSRSIIKILNDYSINFNLTDIQIDQATNENVTLMNASFHSGGCKLSIKEFNASSQLRFQMLFEGEGKRFKIELEYNNSNPDGFLSFFVDPDINNTAFKKIAELLKSTAVNGNSEKVKSNDNNIESVDNGIPESVVTKVKAEKEEPLVAELQERELEDVAPVINEDELTIFKISQHSNGGCCCPQDNRMYYSETELSLSDVSDRFRKLLVVEAKGKLLIQKCEHCGEHLFFESSNQTYLKKISTQTAEYLLSMKAQIEVVCKDKGVSVLREKILPAE